jgi:hypothetical protein
MKLKETPLLPATPESRYDTDLQRALMPILRDTAIIVNQKSELSGGNSFKGAQTVAFVALVDAATIDTDAALSNHFRVTLGGNRTLANPTNMRDGGIYNWRVRQPAAGGPWVISSYGSLFRWNAGVPVYPTGANAVLRITGQYVGSDNVIECTWTSGWVV